jgi:hypothetical protein
MFESCRRHQFPGHVAQLAERRTPNPVAAVRLRACPPGRSSRDSQAVECGGLQVRRRDALAGSLNAKRWTRQQPRAEG